MNEMQKVDIQQILAEHNIAAWDGSRIKKLLELLQTIFPMILPFIVPLLEPKAVEESDKLQSAEATEKLGAWDWKAIFALIQQLLPILIDIFTPAPAPTPTPNPGPVV